jgi:GNAT superfamily N-acetyltransferase
MLQKRIEEASLNAWPALQQILLDGWILRFSEGYTKRANSINPLYDAGLDTTQKIKLCEQIYRERNLPAIFRLNSFAAPRTLDQLLEKQRYRLLDRTLVQYLKLADFSLPPVTQTALQAESLDDWLSVFSELSGSALQQHDAHRTLLKLIPGKTLFAVLTAGDDIVACGLGVLETGCLGLFDLITAEAFRNRGYGSQLVTAMLHWAREQGARHAYLQVVSDNTSARCLYDKLGFKDIYHYWYRVPQAD